MFMFVLYCLFVIFGSGIVSAKFSTLVNGYFS